MTSIPFTYERMMFLCIGLCLSISGCQIWNQYAHPDFSETRAKRICHPLDTCSQGKWWQPGKSDIDQIVDYAGCEERLVQQFGKWTEHTIALGHEIGACMRTKGYELTQ